MLLVTWGALLCLLGLAGLVLLVLLATWVRTLGLMLLAGAAWHLWA